ncbi:MAG: oligosaccharide repeat unit polymerase [Verrucomicrobiaceae bacterium]|nr:MAG: oligosaccharide repeat unit polymerase [Verrucomicrobiaceae bacterium]
MKGPLQRLRRRWQVPSISLGADPTGSFILATTCALAMVVSGGNAPSEVARGYALWIGGGLLASCLLDFTCGVRNLIRTDLLCLLALYFLTLTEFLFPQPEFDIIQNVASVKRGSDLVAITFLVMAAARHLVPRGAIKDARFRFDDISPSLLVGVLAVCAALAYFHMLLAVSFNPVALLEGMSGPRFGVPWARGRFGGWKELLNEFGLLLNVIPPLTATLWHKRKFLSIGEKLLVVGIFSLTMFQGFSSGTRNVFAGYIAAFLGGYMLTHPRLTWWRAVKVGVPAAALFFVGSYHMLEFRNMGLSSYLEGKTYASGETRETLFVDYNLHAISALTDVFPKQFRYLGAELPIWSLIKPIPRAIWPGKPEGLSVSIEDALGADGWTVATTFIGEAYMSFGVLGVIAFAAVISMGATWWNRLGCNVSSTYAILVYASGLAAFALTTRSMLWFTTAMLPSIALVVAHRVFFPNQQTTSRGKRNATVSTAAKLGEGDATK